MALRPLHNRIVVERSETSEQKSAGGIIIPDSAKEKPQEATVVAVGPGKIDKDGKRQPMDVKVGDRILIGKYSGSDIKIDNKEYVILTEDEVLAVIEGKSDAKKAA
jgi:chaperonin GroES